MKHYLDLVSISNKVHRRQSRMTRICIVLAVFLVAVMFGLADMYLKKDGECFIYFGMLFHRKYKM